MFYEWSSSIYSQEIVFITKFQGIKLNMTSLPLRVDDINGWPLIHKEALHKSLFTTALLFVLIAIYEKKFYNNQATLHIIKHT